MKLCLGGGSCFLETESGTDTPTPVVPVTDACRNQDYFDLRTTPWKGCDPK